MIIDTQVTPLDNQVVCGERLVPADKNAAHAVYARHGRVCGITYVTGSVRPYLRCNPGYQLPPYARDKKSFKRFTWQCEDDRMASVRLDPRDGELVFIFHDDDLDDRLEEKVEECLEFLLGDAFHDELVQYVSSFAG